MFGITVSKAAEICGGKLINCINADVEINEVVIDSRVIQPGNLFAAYRGENADGHNYIARALDMGAAACLAEYLPEGVEGSVIICDNVQAAVEKIVRYFRSTLTIPFLGITGSVGKTTAKEMSAAVLSQHFNVLKTVGNKNNQIGVPLTVSRIMPENNLAVIEMGINHFGEMTDLAMTARPTAALYTNIGHAHLEFLGDLDGVFKAKTEMIPFMPEDACFIINGDDEQLLKIRAMGKKVITYGFKPENDITACDISIDPIKGTSCTIKGVGRELKAFVPAYGTHIVLAAIEGAAVGMAFGLTDDEIVKGLSEFKTIGGRSLVIPTGYITLIDDAYNANPDSVKAALESLSSVNGKKVAILGDMRELGPEAKQMHYETGVFAAEKNIDLLVTCGELSKEFYRGAEGLNRVHFNTNEELIAALPGIIKKGDTVLAKASLGSNFKPVVAALKELVIE